MGQEQSYGNIQGGNCSTGQEKEYREVRTFIGREECCTGDYGRRIRREKRVLGVLRNEYT